MNVENISEAKGLLMEIEELELFLSHTGWKSSNFKLASPVLFVQKIFYKTSFEEYRLPEKLKQKIKSTMYEYLEEKKERLKEL